MPPTSTSMEEEGCTRGDGSSGSAIEDERRAGDLVTSLDGKKRKRGRSGPDAKIEPSSESAISRAIKSSAARQGEPIFFPHKGTTFTSFEEAREFYNLYSWEVGFGIRTNRGRVNANNYTTKKDICCSCEGRNKNARAATCRTGCKAMIRLLRLGDHSWYISLSVTEHNHALSVTCGEKKQWQSHSEIDPMTRDLVRRLRENNVTAGRICSILGAGCGGDGLPVRREVVRSLCARMAQENIKDDITKTMKILRAMKERDPEMEVRFNLGEGGRIIHMLWSTGKNKSSYARFGDAITFDTTYRTNLYNLPFGLFVGINNHFQSVILGGVLLTSEKTEDFEWAFSNFLEVMGGKVPCTVLTDQCQAMAAALRTTMRTARHRWCKWHVLRKAKQWLGNVYSKNMGFKKEFHRLVTEEVSVAKFERRWRQLARKYGIENNKFMKRIYRKRGMWARPYFMDVFCAGMTSTQRSESANHMLKQFIQRSAPMHMFVTKFNEFQASRNEQEDRENHLTKQVQRKRRIGVPIERHAEEIYTRAMYERFNQELYRAGAYTIKEIRNDEEYYLVHYAEAGKPNGKEFKVCYGDTDVISCSCGMYGHIGMLCRHSLKVLIHLDKTKIPATQILDRWRKDEPNKADGEETNWTVGPIQNGGAGTLQLRKQVMMKRLFEVSGAVGSLDEAGMEEAVLALDKIIQARKGAAMQATSSESNEQVGVAAIQIECPPRPKRGGRPPNTSLKAYKAQVKLKNSTTKSKSAAPTTTTDEENPRGGKTKEINELLGA